MPNRGKNKYISTNFQKDIGRVKITKKENERPELTLETTISLEDMDLPELENIEKSRDD